jgi:Zn-dependent M16 (insulinase) family peptidase
MVAMKHCAFCRPNHSCNAKTLFPVAGVFSYLSYRDPNLLKTLEVYDETAKFLRELDMDDDALTKAIIGAMGDVDAYQLPDAKGYSRYACLCL